jgi:hypothetical protein
LGFLWDFYGIPMGVPSWFYDIPLWDVWGNSIGIRILWDSYGISLWFLCYFYDKLIEHKFKLNWKQLKIHWQ